jgi:hypothetical protein
VILETGCNSASGDYTLESDRLTVGPLRQTQMAILNEQGDIVLIAVA